LSAACSRAPNSKPLCSFAIEVYPYNARLPQLPASAPSAAIDLRGRIGSKKMAPPMPSRSASNGALPR
jgi:hypothetical protein